MNKRLKLLIGLLISMSSIAQAEEQVVSKTFCGPVGADIERGKQELLNGAKRAAVSELYGERITSFSSVANFELTDDQMTASTGGLVRIKGNPAFSNGKNFGEGCVTIEAYTTAEDMKKLEPVVISKKECGADPSLSSEHLKATIEEKALLSAITEYDRSLSKLDKDALLNAVHKVIYKESSFIPGTTFYCADAEGTIYPIELEALSSISTSQSNKDENVTTNIAHDVSGIDMIEIPAGEFGFGNPTHGEGDKDEYPYQRKEVESFLMSKYEVTFELFDKYCDEMFISKPSDNGFGRGKRPVINVSWREVLAFIEWYNKKTGKSFRLPTEVEWEYAAKAGTTTRYYTGKCLDAKYENYDAKNKRYSDCPEGIYRAKSLNVGSLEANPWGLYDMLGNVSEWTSSLYNNPYNGSEIEDSKLDQSNTARSIRGVSYEYESYKARPTYRAKSLPGSKAKTLGFRLAMDK